MISLNETERSVIRLIKAFQKRYCNSPTMDELAHMLTMSDDTVQFYVDRLCEKGYVQVECIQVSEREVIVPLFWE